MDDETFDGIVGVTDAAALGVMLGSNVGITLGSAVVDVGA